MRSAVKKSSQLWFGLLLCTLGLVTDAQEWSIGFGATASPEFPGAERWRVLPAPTFRLEYQGLSVQTRGPGVVFDLVPSSRLSLGPLVRYSGGRDDDFLRGELEPLQSIPASVEAGLSLGTGVPLFLISDQLKGVLTLGLDWQTSLPGGYDGQSVSASVGYVLPVTDRWTVISALGAVYQSERYAQQWFSVTPEQADDSALSPFEAGAGWNDGQLSLIQSYRFNDAWSMALVSVYSRYLADAASSPVTQLSESRDRFLLAWGVSYQSRW
ncbi:MAG: MipA/OmpV family protein [Saccharospirillum sp.]